MVPQKHIDDFIKDFKLTFYKTSAKTGENINKIFYYLISQKIPQNPIEKVSKQIVQKNNKCCY
jgi:hypothetical protein